MAFQPALLGQGWRDGVDVSRFANDQQQADFAAPEEAVALAQVLNQLCVVSLVIGLFRRWHWQRQRTEHQRADSILDNLPSHQRHAKQQCPQQYAFEQNISHYSAIKEPGLHQKPPDQGPRSDKRRKDYSQ
ncbi:hypothetical protein ALO72_200142 [Pseudomonas syringae pv. delphinii]|nr:hypothetical protein ALO72_200142 [Pseudomonas syringae pv. delphinii]